MNSLLVVAAKCKCERKIHFWKIFCIFFPFEVKFTTFVHSYRHGKNWDKLFILLRVFILRTSFLTVQTKLQATSFLEWISGSFLDPFQSSFLGLLDLMLDSYQIHVVSTWIERIRISTMCLYGNWPFFVFIRHIIMRFFLFYYLSEACFIGESLCINHV